jgi:hypothetical protein
LRAKYSSTHIAIATTNSKLSKLPIPRRDKMRKKVIVAAVIIPLLDEAKINENVKRSVMKRLIKKRRIIPNVPGSTK